MNKIMDEILDYVRILLIALIVTNVLNVFVFSLSQVRQSSMETTLMEKDQLIVEKLSYTFSEPDHGDIIVFIDEMAVDNSIPARFKRLYQDIFAKFTGNQGHLRLVKRIIGIPGDEIDIKDGTVYVNGEALNEEYVDGTTNKKELDYPLIVPENCYYVMGDNRSVSYDSRDFGCISINKIEGKVAFRFYPFDQLGLVH